MINTVQAGNAPAPQLQQDRDSIRSASGLTCSSTKSPDMVVSGGFYQDNEEASNIDYRGFDNDRGRDKGVYVAVSMPITFGSRKKVNCNRLYELELEIREAELTLLKEELRLLKKVKKANTFGVD